MIHLRVERAVAFVLVGIVLHSGGCARAGDRVESRDPVSPAEAVARTLDGFHDAAAKADEARYFSHFAAEGVFLGTDGSERWTVPQFREYAHPHFAKGTGWTYRATDRHIELAPDGRVAWFDEVLDNASYGPCRGTGVLRKNGDEWKIAQYNLMIPIPNDLAKRVVEMIRQETRNDR